jgi:hypothetical protein
MMPVSAPDAAELVVHPTELAEFGVVDEEAVEGE